LNSPAGAARELVLLALLGVIERRLFDILPSRVSNGIHVDDMVAVFGRVKGFRQHLAVLLDVPPLCVA